MRPSHMKFCHERVSTEIPATIQQAEPYQPMAPYVLRNLIFLDAKSNAWYSNPNPLKPGVKSRMKIFLEQRRGGMLQLHLSSQQVYFLLSCALY